MEDGARRFMDVIGDYYWVSHQMGLLLHCLTLMSSNISDRGAVQYSNTLVTTLQYSRLSTVCFVTFLK